MFQIKQSCHALVFTLVACLAACGSGGSGADDDADADAHLADAGPGSDGGPVSEICATLPPLASGTCNVTAGGADLVIQGDILTPGKIYVGGKVVVAAGGTISCVGCDCEDAAATTLTCPQAAVSPGLINTHDHITFSQNSPYTDTGERYEQRNDWRKGKRGHTSIPAPGGATGEDIRYAELRFLLGGATSTAGAGGQRGLLRNLDTSNQEGLGQDVVDSDTFPLGDTSGQQLTSGCAYPDIQTASGIASKAAYLPHVSEGVDEVARNEFLCLSSSADGGQDLLLPQTSIVHGVALTATDFGLMAARKTGLIWSPRSNITLYGDTAQVAMAHRLGVRIALGTDWLPSGSMNLLRELQCATDWNQARLGGAFSDEDLWRMVTIDAAAATATDDVIGVLAPGHLADIAIFSGAARSGYGAVVHAEPDDIALVMRGGKPLYGDPAVLTGLGAADCEAVDVCGSGKSVCLMSEIGEHLPDLEAARSGSYLLVSCDTPPDEPSCEPMRPESVDGSSVYDGMSSAEDSDGDGVPNASDDCPTIFDPIRVVDGAQPDTDGDGTGDLCDPCPLAANTTTCPPPDPNDRDGDGFLDQDDNCPLVANPDQADADGDLKGDACDTCAAADPGNTPCPTTIYSIKDGTAAVGSQVTIAPALVTARNASGFFLQLARDDDDYIGQDYSGIFVYDPSNTVERGQRVAVERGRVTNFFGEIELDTVTVTVTDPTPAILPDVIVASPAEIASGGDRAAALEGTVVQVADVTVSAVDLGFNELTVDAGLVIDDFLYLITPLPSVGSTFDQVSGPLVFRNSKYKIAPRDGDDVQSGPPVLAKLDPALTYIRVDSANASTFPEVLTVSLSAPAVTSTFVAVTSDDPSVVIPAGGVTIDAGEQSAPLLLSGNGSTGTATLTASLDGLDRSAQVRALGSSEAAELAVLTPLMAGVVSGGTVTFTVILDRPAPAGGTTVSLATTAGSVPVSVVVPADGMIASFVYTNAGEDSATVSATVGATTLEAMVTRGAPASLVINEIDYDQDGTDTDEFIEIYNPGVVPVSLAGKAVVLCNGSASVLAEYDRFDLSSAGSLGPGAYLVIASSTVPVASGATTLLFAAASNNVQNGAPDGVALIDTGSLEVVDALAYEGAMSCTIDGLGSKTLVEGTALAATVADTNSGLASLARLPNGSDTNDAATDWALSTTPTPGNDNVP
jgi:cytosine/adenosine deaminase-related metal-dependent hydrolase